MFKEKVVHLDAFKMQSNFQSVFVLIFIVFIGRSTANVFTEEEEIRIKSYIDTMMLCQNVTGNDSKENIIYF
jgi:hypothetical protein